MSVSQAAYTVEEAVGHDDSAITSQDVSRFERANDADSMDALVWAGKKQVEIARVAKPKIVEDTDVILKVTGTTVCGSDLHLLHGAVVQMSKGDILGHEFCGVAELVGRAVHNVEVGKRYVASFQIACGSCYYCKQQLSSQCEMTNSNSMEKAMYGGRTAGMFGYSHFTGGFAGGQAEYVRVPLGNVNLLEIPDDITDEKALFLSDVLPTSYHCVVDTGVSKDDSVAIFGAGPIGNMAGQFALAQGAAKVIFVDTGPRLSQVRQSFRKDNRDKIDVVDFKELSHGITNKETVVSRLKELCNDGRGPDVTLECAAGEYARGWAHKMEIAVGAETDTSEILNEMVESVRSFGRCGVTGIYTNHFNIGTIMQRGVRLIGNGQAPVHKYWHKLLSMVQNRDINPLSIISHRARLQDLEKVYRQFEAGQMQKVFVETKFSFERDPDCPEVTAWEDRA